MTADPQESTMVKREPAIGQAARGSVLNFASMVVSAIATLALTVVVTRLTSPAEAGVFFSATSLFLIATGLGRMGTDTGLVYFISGSRARGELHHAQAYMRAAAVPVLIASLIVAIILATGASPLASLRVTNARLLRICMCSLSLSPPRRYSICA